MQDWKMTDHQKAGGGKFKTGNWRPNRRTGKCKARKCRTGKWI